MRFTAQFGHPTGLMGWLVGLIMSIENRERIDWAIDLLDVKPEDRVLEIGFGPGLAIKRLSAHASRGFVAGVDVSDVMLRQAQNRNRDAMRVGRVELRQGTVEHLPYTDKRFDKALAINSLHHWPDQQAGLTELYRVLKSDGILAIVEQPPSKMTLQNEIEARGREIQALLSYANFDASDISYSRLQRGLSLFIRAKKSH
jgi:ubiquinone/menaquinone biosynthesis C-methylase UbiE